MATEPVSELPLVVIVGPTASGKSKLAIDLAGRFNGEIICADSRTIYTGLDIATAKPTQDEQQLVAHWGLDLVEPGARFTAANFRKYADRKIVEIRNRGHIPFLVGGTGLYVDAVLFGYTFGSVVNEKLRLELQQMSLDELHDYCSEHNINLPENDKNKRYVMRAIENAAVNVEQNATPVYKNIIVGITTDKNVLRNRIETRIEQMLENGVVEEAKKLGKMYGWKSESMTSNIYPLIHKYLQNELTIDELKVQSATIDWRLAKRQLTWLKRNKFIHWLDLSDANTYLSNQLAHIE
ncbi:tRNA (adenosine(37)-N6)-dimethylallyltransferase MiaA [Patescibacteria group bacterium]|nr:MAG: tRNA (adenosine(37)-N6)-dimethylallyltransferase MiaA [Patescibacteria group bacterium]